jgi:hypothetical protein
MFLFLGYILLKLTIQYSMKIIHNPSNKVHPVEEETSLFDLQTPIHLANSATSSTKKPITKPKRPSCIQRCCTCFLHGSDIVDLTEDNVRSRGLTVIAMLLIYIYAVFTLIGLPEEAPVIINEI